MTPDPPRASHGGRAQDGGGGAPGTGTGGARWAAAPRGASQGPGLTTLALGVVAEQAVGQPDGEGEAVVGDEGAQLRDVHHVADARLVHPQPVLLVGQGHGLLVDLHLRPTPLRSGGWWPLAGGLPRRPPLQGAPVCLARAGPGELHLRGAPGTGPPPTRTVCVCRGGALLVPSPPPVPWPSSCPLCRTRPWSQGEGGRGAALGAPRDVGAPCKGLGPPGRGNPQLCRRVHRPCPRALPVGRDFGHRAPCPGRAAGV